MDVEHCPASALLNKPISVYASFHFLANKESQKRQGTSNETYNVERCQTDLVESPTQGVPLGWTSSMKKMTGAQNVSDILRNIYYLMFQYFLHLHIVVLGLYKKHCSLLCQWPSCELMISKM